MVFTAFHRSRTLGLQQVQQATLSVRDACGLDASRDLMEQLGRWGR